MVGKIGKGGWKLKCKFWGSEEWSGRTVRVWGEAFFPRSGREEGKDLGEQFSRYLFTREVILRSVAPISSSRYQLVRAAWSKEYANIVCDLCISASDACVPKFCAFSAFELDVIEAKEIVNGRPRTEHGTYCHRRGDRSPVNSASFESSSILHFPIYSSFSPAPPSSTLSQSNPHTPNPTHLKDPTAKPADEFLTEKDTRSLPQPPFPMPSQPQPR